RRVPRRRVHAASRVLPRTPVPPLDPCPQKVRAWHPDLDATQVTTERGEVIVDRDTTRGRVGGIVAGHRLEQVCAVLHRARHGAGMVERPRERQDTGATHTSVCWLEPNDATEGGGAADGATGVRARRTHHQPGREGRPRATTRAPGDVVEVPGITRRRQTMPG